VELDDVIRRWRVPHDKRVKLKDYDPAWDGDDSIPREERKASAEESLSRSIAKLSEAQNLLYAADSWSVLVVLQALDAAGKDGTIRHVLTGVNPQGIEVHNFKAPSSLELDHDFLWRCARALPERGRIGIFNRSYYEEVLVVKVHPELVQRQRLPKGDPDKQKFWEHRYESINAFERHLTRNGTHIIKLFLNVSREEQKKRFLERIEDPNKHWKFSATDVAERTYWNEYMRAYEAMLTATSTKWAPWHVVPADNKWVTRAGVATILAREIDSLELKFPEPSPEAAKALAEAKLVLEAERD
jgi:PPK2 family polyphosphate:nucleotide phosphotransferase